MKIRIVIVDIALTVAACLIFGLSFFGVDWRIMMTIFSIVFPFVYIKMDFIKKNH